MNENVNIRHETVDIPNEPIDLVNEIHVKLLGNGLIW